MFELESVGFGAYFSPFDSRLIFGSENWELDRFTTVLRGSVSLVLVVGEMRWKCLLDSCFRSWQRAVSFVILFSARVCSKPLMVSGEILIKTAVVSLVHELFVGLGEVHFFAHHHCGRPFVSRFDDDVSSSLESFKGL